MTTLTAALEIELGDDDATLVRVLTVLRRRGCVIRRVDFEADDPHRPGHLTVAVQAPASHAHCVAAWVENLVDVRAVSDRSN
jgi:acetolactate synthase regulatory subunit